MKKKLDNIHHFADEFALEDFEGEGKVEGIHHHKPSKNEADQLTELKKQISDINKKIERLEKIINSKT